MNSKQFQLRKHKGYVMLFPVHLLYRIDDIEDGSELRRGLPAAHLIYGVAQTINCANYAYFIALDLARSLNHPKVKLTLISLPDADVFLTECSLSFFFLVGGGCVSTSNFGTASGSRDGVVLEGHVSLSNGGAVQGSGDKELVPLVKFLSFYRSQAILQAKFGLKSCIESGGIFLMCVGLLQLFSEDRRELSQLISRISVFFQIRDDYENLMSDEVRQVIFPNLVLKYVSLLQ